MFKYEPSAGVLDETYQRLLRLRAEFQEETRRLYREAPTAGFGVFDDDEYRKQQSEYGERVVAADTKLAVVNSLLAPFEAEARSAWEWHQRRACDRMMHL